MVNNTLERFNRELKKRISLRPSMPEFITGRVKKHEKPRRKEKATEHKIPDDYINFII